MKTPITAVIGVYNEEKSVQNVCRQLQRCGVSTIVTIINGCTDRSLEKIKQLQGWLNSNIIVEQFGQPLGHDISRAIGTYVALRCGLQPSFLLYVDADWAGSFGPNLEEFVQFGIETQAEVLSVPQSALSSDWCDSPAARRWQSALAKQSIVPCHAAPYLLPMMVHNSVFRKLSPIWLAHPGLWLTSAAEEGMNWLTFPDWSMDMIGHQTRLARHREAIEGQLHQDAEDAYRLLDGKHANTSFASILASQNHIGDANLAGVLPKRDYGKLLQYASTATFTC